MQKYTEKEIEILREGGKRLAHILEVLGENCVEGVRAKDLDLLAEKMVLENGDIPVFKNYKPKGAAYPFPASLCVSINDVVAHGIPKDEILKAGDVVSLDLGLRHAGLVVDSAISVLVAPTSSNPSSGMRGTVPSEQQFFLEKKLLEVTKKALSIGIEKCVVGNRVNDVGIAIEKYVLSEGFTVVDVLCGHAVGREIHSEPLIPHADYGLGGEKIKEGMVLAIEPHISIGDGQITISSKDAWAYIADDGHKSAQFEHTILVTNAEPIILTKK
jgi:methionyl aminopeptidase